ncbi:hypothetical protein GCM10027447_18850 [Glycomyces halotolerans]
MDVVRIVALLAALVLSGLMAGVFFAFAVAVMPGLRRIGDTAFVAAFQAVDRAIVNPLFVSVFLGALLITGAAGLLHLNRGAEFGWTIASFVLYLAVFAITVRVHIPRNDAIKAAGAVDGAEAAAVRERFDERAWARWNTVRAALTTAAFCCLALAVAAG